MHRFLLLGICGIGLQLAGTPAQVTDEENTTASPEPVAAFVEHCYDPIRLHRRPKLPTTDSGWTEAGGSVREELEIRLPNEKAFIRPVADGRGFMILQMLERVLTEARGADRNESRQSCRIVYEGPDRPEAIRDALEDLFDGLQGYKDPAGLRSCGYEINDDWHQWLWSDNPGKDDRRWKMVEGRRGRSTCLFATTDRYYTATDLVHVRLVVKEGAPELTMIEINRTYRPDPKAPKGRPKVDVIPLGTSSHGPDKEERAKSGTKKDS